MFNLIVKVKVDHDKINEFESSIQNLIEEQNKGCKGCGKLYRSTSDHNVFYYQEEWKSRARLDKHIHSEKFRILLGCIKSLGNVLESKISKTVDTEKLK